VSELSLLEWGTLAGLLLVSGFFSSAETALFSLTPAQRARASEPVRRLVAKPRRLLITVLLGNLITNLFFFSFAERLAADDAGVRAIAVRLGVLVVLLVCGEILPKTLGLRARASVAHVTAVPLGLVVPALGWLAQPLVAFLERCNRLVSLVAREEAAFRPDVLAHVMERGAAQGVLLGMEAELVVQAVELGQVRVREIMTPRVDALFLDVSGEGRDGVVARALATRQSWLPVSDGVPDRILGRVRVRDLLQSDARAIRELVMPVHFVPEVADALDLLRSLHAERTTEAVVVDEWGGTAGFVTAEDVFESLVGDLRTRARSGRAPSCRSARVATAWRAACRSATGTRPSGCPSSRPSSRRWAASSRRCSGASRARGTWRASPTW
jgi:CBS domain containing-hemolysin-like protein